MPSKEEVLEYIRTTPGKVGKRELARAFKITGANRALLNALLKDLAEDGEIERGHKRRFHGAGSLPEVTVVDVFGTDSDGELLARPVQWTHDDAPPRIYMNPTVRGDRALGVGDRALVKLKQSADGTYEGRAIRRLTAAPIRLLGVFEMTPEGARLRPTDRRQKSDYIVAKEHTGGATHGALVLAEPLPGKVFGLRPAKVIEVLGGMDNPKAISLIAINSHDIPCVFPEAALQEAEDAGPAPLGKREDLRDIPLVTIDGEDARDFDDAVFAEPDPNHEGGWHLIVAIADVSWYVRPNDPLDKEAYKRGNSVYFPDRVVPMLPEALSNGWCSLNPKVERPCLAVHMWIDKDGHRHKHKFVRGLMRSAARLTYERAQAARDGHPDDETGPLTDDVIAPLYGAYESLQRWREVRGTLELDIAERKVVVDDKGKVVKVVERERLDSHKLIEEFMIAANVAAAEELQRLKQPCMYRVHDLPNQEKLESLREFLGSLNLNLAKGQVIKPHHFNQILEKVKDTPESHLVSMVVLRSQAQAVYSPDNLGHFGLGLRNYAHFTSPIRRYSDLLVHRALVRGLRLGDGPLPDDQGIPEFVEIGEHISTTERRAAEAERDAVDRFTAAYLADNVGATFSGRINGVTRFGLFVTLDDSGADGLVPISTLPNDYYDHDEARHSLVGRATGRTYRLGEKVEVRLSEADPLTGSMVFHMMGGGEDGAPRPNAPLRRARMGAKKGRMSKLAKAGAPRIKGKAKPPRKGR